MTTQKAIFAGGCFWGVEHLMKDQPGVMATTVGYAGGHVDSPSYEQVLTHTTGHLEALEIEFDADKVSYETLAKLFFEIHDPTQENGQGPDIGEQYHSAIFYFDDEQKQVAEKLIEILKSKGLRVVTKLIPFSNFWPAEEYHQKYYDKTGKEPYCHVRVNRF